GRRGHGRLVGANGSTGGIVPWHLAQRKDAEGGFFGDRLPRLGSGERFILDSQSRRSPSKATQAQLCRRPGADSPRAGRGSHPATPATLDARIGACLAV